MYSMSYVLFIKIERWKVIILIGDFLVFWAMMNVSKLTWSIFTCVERAYASNFYENECMFYKLCSHICAKLTTLLEDMSMWKKVNKAQKWSLKMFINAVGNHWRTQCQERPCSRGNQNNTDFSCQTWKQVGVFLLCIHVKSSVDTLTIHH